MTGLLVWIADYNISILSFWFINPKIIRRTIPDDNDTLLNDYHVSHVYWFCHFIRMCWYDANKIVNMAFSCINHFTCMNKCCSARCLPIHRVMPFLHAPHHPQHSITSAKVSENYCYSWLNYVNRESSWGTENFGRKPVIVDEYHTPSQTHKPIIIVQ